MQLYDVNGYLNIEAIIEKGYPFTFIVGGRGTGKTFGTLRYLAENHIRFLLLRRTQTQADLIGKQEFSPFKALTPVTGKEYAVKSLSKNNSAVYEGERDDDGKLVATGSPLCYTAALSTISSMRGFDASDVDIIMYDEFIPERHERPLKNEADALFNAYETVNRNRELTGAKPVQLLCLANSNDLGNPLFLSLGIVSRAERMRDKGVEMWQDPDRGILLILLQGSPISHQKAGTALYKLTAGSDFRAMAVDNRFSAEERGCIKSRPLREYRPIVKVGELCIYRHKSSGRYYVTEHISGTVPEYSTGDTSLMRFRRDYVQIWDAYLDNDMDFEAYICEILLRKYFGMA